VRWNAIHARRRNDAVGVGKPSIDVRGGDLGFGPGGDGSITEVIAYEFKDATLRAYDWVRSERGRDPLPVLSSDGWMRRRASTRRQARCMRLIRHTCGWRRLGRRCRGRHWLVSRVDAESVGSVVEVGRSRSVVLSFLYWLSRRLLELLVLRVRSERGTEIEILVPRPWRSNTRRGRIGRRCSVSRGPGGVG
jgi:hypothetical protein